MDSAVEEIKSRLNIVDLVGEYVRLQKAGISWKARCPFHNEKTPSFVVSEEKQIWHCFGCQKGGDIFGFVMEMEGLEFKEVLKNLADKAGVKLSQYRHSPEAKDSKDKIFEILELATKFYEKQLWDGAGKDKILKYLRGRGLKEEMIKAFRLGYAPAGWRNILTFLTGRGYKIEDIEKTGLLVKKSQDAENEKKSANYGLQTTSYYDRFRNRIIFPINEIMGKVIGFSARVAPGDDESQAKYVNTPETTVYHKSKILYGIDKAKQEIKRRNYTLLVEGNMDVIACHQAGIVNTVAISGTALTPDQIDILKRYSDNIKMFFDMDAAGEEAAQRSSELAFQKDVNVSVARAKEGKDAAEIASNNPQLLLQAVENSSGAMEYFFDGIFRKYDREKAENKKIIGKEILNLIRNFRSPIEKSHWMKKLSQELEVEEKSLWDVLKRAEESNRQRAKSGNEIQEKIVSSSRREMLQDKIIGLMLSSGEVWKKITEEEGKIRNILAGEKLFSFLVAKGKAAGYSYEALISQLEDGEDLRKLMRLYFDSRFSFSPEGQIEEHPWQESWNLVQRYLGDIKKEICRSRLRTIARDLEKAERSADKEAVKILMEEFAKLSKELK